MSRRINYIEETVDQTGWFHQRDFEENGDLHTSLLVRVSVYNVPYFLYVGGSEDVLFNAIIKPDIRSSAEIVPQPILSASWPLMICKLASAPFELALQCGFLKSMGVFVCRRDSR